MTAAWSRLKQPPFFDDGETWDGYNERIDGLKEGEKKLDFDKHSKVQLAFVKESNTYVPFDEALKINVVLDNKKLEGKPYIAGYLGFMTVDAFLGQWFAAPWFAKLKSDIQLAASTHWLLEEDDALATEIEYGGYTPTPKAIITAMQEGILTRAHLDEKTPVMPKDVTISEDTDTDAIRAAFLLQAQIRIIKIMQQLMEHEVVQNALTGPCSDDQSLKPGDFGREAEDICRLVTFIRLL